MAEKTKMSQIDDARNEEPIQKPKSLYCHQCHQRRPNAVGNCVTTRPTTRCSVKYCLSCLKKYDETAEEIASKTDWVCFKCRGICECYMCMRKKDKRLTEVSRRTSNEYSNDSSSAGCSSNENAEARTEPVPEKRKRLEEVKLPEEIQAITILGVDLPPENAGRVLQFLQFSSTFREAIGFRKEQAQLVVREILLGRSEEHSTLIQTIIQLLTLLLVDRGGITVGLGATDDRWFTILGECLAKSAVKLDEFPPEMFQKGISEYDKMDSSQRLRLLNFLCDETLNTAGLREFMCNHESFEKEKEAKEKVKAAEAKERQFDQKIKDEMAKAQAANNGVELTCEQQCAIVSLMEAESEQIFAEKKNASDMLKNLEYDDELRTRPFELDDNGRIVWKLKSYKEEANILLQDLKRWSDGYPHEKWFTFSPEQKPQVEEYITRKRKKGLPEKEGEDCS